MAPRTGGVGTTGGALITTSGEDGDVHPEALVTVKYHVPDAISVTVRVGPLPFMLLVPGSRCTVQLPASGSPLSETLPIDTVQDG